jgi:hypothetical protein
MRSNLWVAQRKDGELPTFESKETAERDLFSKRDASVEWLIKLAAGRHKVLPFEPRALETLEDLYFELWDGGLASRFRGDRARFEFAMGMFWGAVAVAAAGASWTIYESPFVPGHYGVSVSKGGSSVVLNGLGTHWDRKPGNSRHRRLPELYDQIMGRA